MSEIAEILKSKGLDGPFDETGKRFSSISADDVRRELARPAGRYSFERLVTLISPAATDFLEEMAVAARQLTIQRFGRTVQMYAPLYVSNYCVNSCRYCGFNCKTKFDRTRLTIEQACADADVIASEGFRHILLVSGEDRKYISPDYLAELAVKLREKFCSVSIEVHSLDEAGYRRCLEGGIDEVALYQETFNRERFSYYHVAGPKADYDNRLETFDRAGKAGMRRLGLGFLLGLEDWRCEILALGEHAAYLMRKYWQAQVSFSFPRLRPAPHVAEQYRHLVSDRELVQMMLALRLCFGDAGIVISTRESAELRDRLVDMCVTKISAGSKTNPGGYTSASDSTEQFVIDDGRSPLEVAEMIKASGREAVWKDWDASFNR